jgi:hypothetical protein
MARFDRGVTSYTFAEATIQVCFPEDEVKCKWCPFLKHYDSMDRDKCGLTEEILFSKEIIGQHCPLTILNTVEAKELET